MDAEGLAGSAAGSRGSAAACERDLAVWLGFAGPMSPSDSDSSSDEVGRSPGAAGLLVFLRIAASFLAFAAARRCSRVMDDSSTCWSASDSSSEEDSSSSDEEASFLSRGSCDSD